jgi:BirA family biotin operon repressor/biotin-[acetyl-CoA-carboxylase] ligase
LEILYFDSLPSTQKYLVEAVRGGKHSTNVAIVTKRQTNGVGSRNNNWIAQEGDLLFSFAMKKSELPGDLPMSSASIYFAFLIKEILLEMGVECWLKWPNDIYIDNKKCGGIVTQVIREFYIVGIGINLVPRDDNFAHCNADINVKNILKSYFLLLKKAPKWQEVFSKYRLEFEVNKEFSTTINGVKVPINRAILCSDGSLIIDNERIYSLR